MEKKNRKRGPSSAKRSKINTYEMDSNSEDSEGESDEREIEIKKEIDDSEFQIKTEIENSEEIEKSTMKHIPFVGTPGLLRTPDGSTPMDYFNLLVDQNYYETIVEYTNMYANNLLQCAETKKSRITEWKQLNVPEFRKFIGLLLHMGTIQVNRIQDYWKKHKLFDLTCISRHMSRNRFFLISRCLHFFARGASSAEAKINPIIDYFNRKMMEVYYPEKQLLIDETMVPWRGKLKFRQYIQGKSRKHDLKLYALIESTGLTLKIKVYTGKNATGIKKTILELLQDQLYKGHSVYMTNYHNCVNLADKMLTLGTYCTGTTRNMRKEIVVAFENSKEDEVILFKCNNGVVTGEWKDKCNVRFISTEHTGELVQIQNLKKKPKAVVEYNKFMGGINRRDQLLSSFAYDKKTVRWYIKLWTYVLDNLMLNSYFLYDKYSDRDKISFYDFRLNIIDNLLFENSLFILEEHLPEAATDHLPQKLERSERGNVKRKRCRFCYKSGNRKNTPYFCPSCPEQPGLCLHPCFGLYHKQ